MPARLFSVYSDLKPIRLLPMPVAPMFINMRRGCFFCRFFASCFVRVHIPSSHVTLVRKYKSDSASRVTLRGVKTAACCCLRLFACSDCSPVFSAALLARLRCGRQDAKKFGASAQSSLGFSGLCGFVRFDRGFFTRQNLLTTNRRSMYSTRSIPRQPLNLTSRQKNISALTLSSLFPDYSTNRYKSLGGGKGRLGGKYLFCRRNFSKIAEKVFADKLSCM